MKGIHRIALMVAAIALLAISLPVYASEMDNRIESSPGSRMHSRHTSRLMILRFNP